MSGLIPTVLASLPKLTSMDVWMTNIPAPVPQQVGGMACPNGSSSIPTVRFGNDVKKCSFCHSVCWVDCPTCPPILAFVNSTAVATEPTPGPTPATSAKTCRAADTAGWEDSWRYTCASYVTNGWCLDSRYDITGTGGAQANCVQCCVLSGGAAPTGGSTPRTPATTEGTDHHNNNTGAGASEVSILAGLAGSVASTTGAAIAVAASSSIVAGAVISVAVAPTLAAVAGVGGGAASGGVSSMGGAGVDAGAAAGFLLEHLQSLALLSRLPTIQQCGGGVFSMVTGGSLAWSNLHLPLPAAAKAAFGLSPNDTTALGGEGDGGENGSCGGSSIPEMPPNKGQRRRRLFGEDSLNASNWMAGMSGQGCHSILATLSASIKGSIGATARGTGGNDAHGVNSTAEQQHKKSESLLKKAKALLFGNLFWATLIFISLMSLHATIAYALAGRCGSLCTKGYSKHMRRWLS